MIPLTHFIVLGAILFCLSMAGIFLNRKNVIILLMSIELMLLVGEPELRRVLPVPRRHRRDRCSCSSS